tara:strand:- start:1 stop:144 length:144 start_codon:yes stop_codon:yes gene_type:complete
MINFFEINFIQKKIRKRIKSKRIKSRESGIRTRVTPFGVNTLSKRAP